MILMTDQATRPRDGATSVGRSRLREILETKAGLVVSLLLIAVTGAHCLQLAEAILQRPFSSGRIIFFIQMLLAAFILANRAVEIVQRLRPNLLIRVAGWPVQLLFPFLLVAIVDDRATVRSVSVARQTLAPFISSLERVDRWPDKITTSDPVAPALRQVLVKRAPDRFLLSVQSGDIALEGATLFYDSLERRWDVFTNDEPEDELVRQYIDKSSRARSRKVYTWTPSGFWAAGHD